jgi:protein-tyrosine phosphatase
MDEDNLRDIRRLAPDDGAVHKVRLIMDFAPAHTQRSVPDPYYGTEADFDQVFAMLDEACDNLLDGLADA